MKKKLLLSILIVLFSIGTTTILEADCAGRYYICGKADKVILKANFRDNCEPGDTIQYLDICDDRAKWQSFNYPIFR